MIQKAFKIGNSIAITIPKEANIKSGTKLKFSKRVKNKITYEIVDETSPTIKDHIEETSGGFDIDIDSKKLDKLLKYLEEHPYER